MFIFNLNVIKSATNASAKGFIKFLWGSVPTLWIPMTMIMMRSSFVVFYVKKKKRKRRKNSKLFYVLVNHLRYSFDSGRHLKKKKTKLGKTLTFLSISRNHQSKTNRVAWRRIFFLFRKRKNFFVFQLPVASIGQLETCTMIFCAFLFECPNAFCCG